MSPENLNHPDVPVPPDLQGRVTVTTLDKIYNWGRVNSLWPMMFGLACCAIEMIATAASRHDFARFGMEVMRPRPRQADVMIVSGTVTKKWCHKLSASTTRCRNPSMFSPWAPVLPAADLSRRGIVSCRVLTGLFLWMCIFRVVPHAPVSNKRLDDSSKLIQTQSLKTVRWYTKEPNQPFLFPSWDQT